MKPLTLPFKHESFKELHDLLYEVWKFEMGMEFKHDEAIIIIIPLSALNLLRNFKNDKKTINQNATFHRILRSASEEEFFKSPICFC